MTGLPPGLQAWEKLLSLFSLQTAGEIGPLLAILDRLVGPMQVDVPRSGGDPEGYAGLDRRGPPERLLLSEWLYAEDFPDEFMRRAAMSEQGYLLLARRTPAEARNCTVFLDTSAAVAGSLRIAQLAAVLVLARRAEQAGARFRWGLMAEPETLSEEVSQVALKRLLNHRSPYKPDLALRPKAMQQGGGGEYWWIGGASVKNWGEQRLILEDPLDIEGLTANISYVSEGDRAAYLTLSLPPQSVCATLLQGGGWAPEPVKPRPITPQKKNKKVYEAIEAVRTVPRNSRILVRTRHTLRVHVMGMQTQRIYVKDQGSTEKQYLFLKKTRHFQSGLDEQIIAATYIKGRVVAVTRSEDGQAWLYGMGRPPGTHHGPARWPLTGQNIHPPEADHFPHIVVFDDYVWFTDGEYILYRWNSKEGLLLLNTGVIELIAVARQAIALKHYDTYQVIAYKTTESTVLKEVAARHCLLSVYSHNEMFALVQVEGQTIYFYPYFYTGRWNTGLVGRMDSFENINTNLLYIHATSNTHQHPLLATDGNGVWLLQQGHKAIQLREGGAYRGLCLMAEAKMVVFVGTDDTLWAHSLIPGVEPFMVESLS